MKKKGLVFLLVLVSIAMLSYFFLMQDFDKALPTIYVNANIITLNENQPNAEAMFVQDGLIKAVGTLQDVTAAATDDAKIVDLDGATVLPGFIDPHTHFMITMFLSEMHDLSGFKHQSNEEVWRYFEEVTKSATPGEWIVCKGIDPILVPDLLTPSMAYLDSILPNNPVLILSQSLHSYWGNSKAFELAGISSDSPDPSETSYYERDKNGDLTGLIVEQLAVIPFMDLLREAVLTSEFACRTSKNSMTAYAKKGITSIVSTGLAINDEKPLLLMRHLSSEDPFFLGNLLTKFGMLPTRKPAPRHFIYMRHDMAHLMPENKTENDFYNIIGIKHWYDGSPYIGTMYLDSAYQDSEFNAHKLDIPAGSRGEALITKEDFAAFIKTNHNKGWQIAIHAQGDAASREVIDAFEALNTELDFSTTRHRMEHCLLLQTDNLSRMKALHMTPSYHINHLLYYGDALRDEVIGTNRAEQILPLHSTGQTGIKYTLHADQPMFESDPFRLIQTAVERKTTSGKIIGEAQKISIMQAIKASTIDAAWQINMEDKIGSLEQGKYADFAVFDKNPLEIAVDQLEHIKCLRTFINGNEVGW